ncbi:MAG: CRTAC1 family protein [Bacteroidetes bacterium]|nr:CRTAC1 family protein [Bacteroidota bacterium]
MGFYRSHVYSFYKKAMLNAPNQIIPMRKRLLFHLIAIIFLFSCGKESNMPNDNIPTVTHQNGHLRMIAILDSIATNADSKYCYNLNSKRAEKLALQLNGNLPIEQKLLMQSEYGKQLLYAGKTEATIVEFQKILSFFGNELTEQTKPIFEMLAISFLRLGEQTNCVEKPNAEACIIPVNINGVYKNTIGMENAIQLYKQLLTVYPNDIQSRWLLNIAYMNLGKYPKEVPEQWLVPQQFFRKKGNIQFQNLAVSLGLAVNGLSGGVCMEDFDNDGDLDLFMTSYGLTDQSKYFRNNGDGTFTENTKDSNLLGITGGLNTLHADYDNDGDVDILVLRGAWMDRGNYPNSLLQNDGAGHFTDVTIEAGMLSFHPTQAAAWADFDADGDLDLFIANESIPNQQPNPCEFFRNNGNGTFTDIASSLGLQLTGFFKGCVWGDVNNDRLPDLYISNLTGDNLLFVNRGNSKFENIAFKAGVVKPYFSFPTWYLDYDNDGLDDIFAAGYGDAQQHNPSGDFLSDLLGTLPQGDYFRVYHNEGNEKFTDVTEQVGLNKLMFAMGVNFGDLNNDGWQDIYIGTGKPAYQALVPNRMFLNVPAKEGNGRFYEEISMNGFANIQKGHGIAFGDMDNDGDQDIYEVMGGAYEGDVSYNMFFKNPGDKKNKWVTVKLEGKTCNKDGIGSKIAVHVANEDGTKKTVFSTVNTGGSFGASSLQQEIGLGAAKSIEEIEVFWAQPGPANSVYHDIPLNSFVKLGEGSDNAEILERKVIGLP